MAKQLDSHNVPRQVRKYIGTAAERAALVITAAFAGSTFYETDTGILWILNTAGVWVQKITNVAGQVTFPSAQDVQLTGSSMELFGPDTTTRPGAGTVDAGTVFVVVDTPMVVYMSDGTSWVEV